jgi:hypothetical protein
MSKKYRLGQAWAQDSRGQQQEEVGPSIRFDKAEVVRQVGIGD